jgi:hypothetical protein
MSHRKQTFFGRIGNSLAQTMSKERAHASAVQAGELRPSKDKLARFLAEMGTWEIRDEEFYWKKKDTINPERAPERIDLYWKKELTEELLKEFYAETSERDPIDELFYLMEKVSEPLRELEQKIERGDIRAMNKAELDVIRAHIKRERDTIEQGFPEDLHKEQADIIAREAEEKLDAETIKNRAASRLRLNNRRIRLAQEVLGLENHLDAVGKKIDLVLLNPDMKRLEEEITTTFKLRENPNIDLDENNQLLLAQQRTVILLRERINSLSDFLAPEMQANHLAKLEAFDSRIQTGLDINITEDAYLEVKIPILLGKVRDIPRDVAHHDELKDVYQQVKKIQSQLEQRALNDAKQDQLSSRFSRVEMYSSSNDYVQIDAARNDLLEYFHQAPRMTAEQKIKDAVFTSEETQAPSTVLSGSRQTGAENRAVAPVSVRSIATVEKFLTEAQMTASMSAVERRDVYQEHKNCRGYVERLQKSLQQAELEMNPADVIECAQKLDDLSMQLQAQRNKWRHAEYDVTTRVKDKVVLAVTGALDGVSSRWSRFIDSLHHQDHESLQRKINTRVETLRTTMVEQKKVLEELKYDLRKLEELQPLITTAKAAVEQSFHELLRYRATKGEKLQQYEKQKPNRPSALRSIDSEIEVLEAEVVEFNQKVAATLETVRNPVILPTTPNQAFETALNKLNNHLVSLHLMKVPPFGAQAEQIPARAAAAYEKAREEFNQIYLDLSLDQMMKFFRVEIEFKSLHAEKTKAVQAEIQRRGAAPSALSSTPSFNPSNPD